MNTALTLVGFATQWRTNLDRFAVVKGDLLIAEGDEPAFFAALVAPEEEAVAAVHGDALELVVGTRRGLEESPGSMIFFVFHAIEDPLVGAPVAFGARG